jgi:plastocyanin
MQKVFNIAVSISILFLLSCAGSNKHITLNPNDTQNRYTVDLEASSFDFEPAEIIAYEGDTIVFNIKSTSGMDHNFSIKNPAGKIIHSVPLPPHQVVQVTIGFPVSGTYDYYCDKPLHAFFGMDGKVVVKKKVMKAE